MDWQKAGENIEKLEAGLDCSQFAVNGVTMWPLIRYYAYFDLVRVRFPNPPKKLPSQNILRMLELDVASSERAIKIAEPLNGGSVFFTRPEEFSQEIGGRLFNPYLDAIWNIADTLGPTARVEIDVGQNLPRVTSARRFYPSRYFSSCSFIRAQVSGLGRSLEIEGCSAVHSALENVFERSFDYFPYENMLREFIGYFEFYNILLARLEPDFVFSVSVGDLRSAGLFAAARSLGIRSVEIQHGLIRGLGEARYRKWPSYPTNGFDVLPDFFWTHDIRSALTIDDWGIPQHRSVVGGQPNFDWLRKKEGLLGDQLSILKSKISPDQTVVLVSLSSGKISKVLVEAMRELGESAFFLIRIHPVFTKIRNENNWKLCAQETMMENERQVFLSFATEGPVTEEFFELEGICNCDLRSASTIPLQFLLDISNVHVTHHSNTAAEAAAFGVPTYFSEKASVVGFEDFQAASMYDVFSSADDLVQKIRAIDLVELSPIKTVFQGQIKIDNETARNALCEIYSAE